MELNDGRDHIGDFRFDLVPLRFEGGQPIAHGAAEQIAALLFSVCKLNSIPFNATGEKIQQEGCWCVYEFTWQTDAILFWDRFEGRWLRESEFHYPERPPNLPQMEPLQNWPRFNPDDTRR